MSDLSPRHAEKPSEVPSKAYLHVAPPSVPGVPPFPLDISRLITACRRGGERGLRPGRCLWRAPRCREASARACRCRQCFQRRRMLVLASILTSVSGATARCRVERHHLQAEKREGDSEGAGGASPSGKRVRGARACRKSSYKTKGPPQKEKGPPQQEKLKGPPQKVDRTTAKVKRTTPKVRRTTPKVRRTTPKVNRTTPKVKRTPPKVNRTTSKSKKDLPKRKQDHTRTTPKVNRTTPKSKKDHTKK